MLLRPISLWKRCRDQAVLLQISNHDGNQLKAFTSLDLYTVLLGFACDEKHLCVASGWSMSCGLLHPGSLLS